jgi:hypothetical protein
MAMREFNDSDGVHWIVWSTKPWTGGVLESLRGGWLTFVSPTTRKRLIGIPDDWEAMPLDRLELLCKVADEVRRTPARGIDVTDLDAQP